MKPFATVMLLGTFLFAACSTTPGLRLQDVQPKRVFRVTHAQAFEAIHLFGLKEGFRFDSMDEATGRIIGHCTFQASPSPNATSKMVIMNLRVFSVDSAHSEVNARFTFSSLNDALTREEENILVDYYLNLYSALEREAK